MKHEISHKETNETIVDRTIYSAAGVPEVIVLTQAEWKKLIGWRTAFGFRLDESEIVADADEAYYARTGRRPDKLYLVGNVVWVIT